jgi:hypothetical protein
VYVTGVQLEKGALVTPFEFRPEALELQLCQRYYEKTFDLNIVPATNLGLGGDRSGVGEIFFVSPADTGGFGSNNFYGTFLMKIHKRNNNYTITIFNCRSNTPNTFSTYAGGARADTVLSAMLHKNTGDFAFFIQRASATLAMAAFTIDNEI